MIVILSYYADGSGKPCVYFSTQIAEVYSILANEAAVLGKQIRAWLITTTEDPVIELSADAK